MMLEYHDRNGQVVSGRVIGIAGLHLQVEQTTMEKGEVVRRDVSLVDASQCSEPDDFWKIHQQLS